jgi:transposase
MIHLLAFDSEAEATPELPGKHPPNPSRANSLDTLKAAIKAARTGALPKSALAKACDYTLTLWSRLSRFLEYPELELSNNLAENAIRPVPLGRRNWIHVGSQEAGPRVAAIISIVETCRRSEPSVPRLPQLCAPGLSRFS